MTSRDDIEPEGERAIDELLDAAAEEADAEQLVRPPFAAVLARARRLDPALGRDVPGAWAPSTGPVEADALVAELAPFVLAARAEAELDEAGLDEHGPPGLPRLGPTRVTRWIAVAGTLAAVAVLVLLWSVLDVERARRATAQREGSQAMDQVDAKRRVLEAETGGNGLPLGRRSSSARGGGARLHPPSEPGYVLPDQPAPLEPVVSPAVIPEEAAPLEPPVPEPSPASDAAPPRRTAPAEPKRQALRRLDDVAAERLAAGDVDGAEAAYRALVRRGGRSGLVELAYGDLFTLAHRRGDPKAQQALWQEYLRKFPRGRFADDAQAGLCRLAQGEAAETCWERYLDRFPTGAYHRQAERMRDRE